METGLSLTSGSYTYQQLPPQNIRILELHPGPPNTPLVCDIAVQLIKGKLYEALSYVWGDPTPVTSIRCVDDASNGDLGIGHNLATLLIAFRLKDQTRRIWIDALCINQDDVHERESQVRLMGAVYSQAKNVLCWLGPFNILNNGPDSHLKKYMAAESSARLAICFLRWFNKNPHEHLQAARQHLFTGENIADSVTAEALLNSWLAIKELFDLEYFHRTWIIQEMGLAAHARLYWGSCDLWLDWTEVATFCRFMDDYGASVVEHLQLKSWVANHISLVWQTDSAGKTRYTFIEVLHWARVHRSTDPRDCVYALLSHPGATIGGKLLIQPNYTISTAQAYVDIAVSVIQCTNSLQILAFVDHHEESDPLNLPTWVPNWHSLNLVAPLRFPTQAATETSTSISVIESGRRMTLKFRGVFIDTVRAMTDAVESTELTITTLEKEMQKKTPLLMDHIWIKTVVEPNIPQASLEYFLTSLSLVLTGGYLGSSRSISGEKLEQQKSDLAALILEYDHIRENDHTDGILAHILPTENAVFQTMAVKGSAHQFVQDMTWVSKCRRIFRTAEGHIGLGPRTMKEGDICIVASGAVYPMILRSCGSYWQLVGPALVYGFMDGEAGKLCQAGTLFEQEFQIV
jgi:Heterokaryon incompatibility protein (HET)